MGRRLLIAAAVSVLPLAAAAPAVAKSHHQKKVLALSVRAGKSHVLHRYGRIPAAGRVTAVGDTVLYSGQKVECTAPNGPNDTTGNGQNFYSSDYVEFQDPSGALVGECVANLKHTFTTAHKKVKYNHSAVTWADVQTCTVYGPTPGSTLTGTGISVTFPNGLFVETCIAHP